MLQTRCQASERVSAPSGPARVSIEMGHDALQRDIIDIAGGNLPSGHLQNSLPFRSKLELSPAAYNAVDSNIDIQCM